jgi:integration host factor subunit beta
MDLRQSTLALLEGPRIKERETMTKSDLIVHIARNNQDLTIREAEILVETIFDSMIDALNKGDRVEIRGFGSFSAKNRPARTGRNPKTGEAIQLSARRTTHFKVGKQLQERINR